MNATKSQKTAVKYRREQQTTMRCINIMDTDHDKSYKTNQNSAKMGFPARVSDWNIVL